MPKPIIRYDAYEIAPCIRTDVDKDGIEIYQAIPNTKSLTPGQKKRLIFTLYGHIHGEGVQAIGDFREWNFAVECYQKITGVRVTRRWKNTRLCGLPTEPGGKPWGQK